MSNPLQFLWKLVKSGTIISTFATVGITGSYVAYTDRERFPRMMGAYLKGCILPPYEDSCFQMEYLHRPHLEEHLKNAMSPHLSNEYYLVTGDVGSGKSRLVQEVIREMISESGGGGAPVYVTACQGRSFAETLAEAVNFRFDEHISFKFFADYVLGIHGFPKRDDGHCLTRVLDAIEKSSYAYLKKTGQPVVLVIDGAQTLSKHHPSIMHRLQEKAKFWADTNTVKMVFVSNEESTFDQLQHSESGWSRAAPAIHVNDLSEEEAIQFLTSPSSALIPDSKVTLPIDRRTAKDIVSLVGGRITYLAVFKRHHLLGIKPSVTASGLVNREKDKFLAVSRVPSQWKVVNILQRAPNQSMELFDLAEQTSTEDVTELLRSNVLRIHRQDKRLVIQFESRLAENVINEIA